MLQIDINERDTSIDEGKRNVKLTRYNLQVVDHYYKDKTFS
jgi:hypothetical protein